jgi:hypothetical protein
MNSAVRLTIAVAITTGLWADSVEYSNFSGVDTTLAFYIPQFDPSLGTLDSMNFTVSAGEVVIMPIDNCNEDGPSPTVDYSYDITTGFSIFGSSVEGTQSGTGSAGSTCGGFHEPGYSTNITGSGSVSDPSPYIGTGVVLIPTDNAFASGLFSDGGGPPSAGFFILQYSATLDVTYDYISVPEPGTLALTLLAGALFWIVRWCRRIKLLCDSR